MRQKKTDSDTTNQRNKPAKREASKSQPRAKHYDSTSGRGARKRQPTAARTSPHPIGEVMTRAVLFIHPDDTLKDAAAKMRDQDIGLLPVCEGDRVIGLLTDRDITIRGTAEGRNPEGTRIREVMSSGAISCFEDQDISEAAQVMRDKQVRRLVVLNRANQLAGIVSLGDLATETADAQLSGETLEGISQPAQKTQS
jgi:CBS domain-containing protein